MTPIHNLLHNLNDYEELRRRMLGEHGPHSQQPARPPSFGQAGALPEVLPLRDHRFDEIHRRGGLSPAFSNPSRPEVLINPFRTPFLNLSDYEELRRRRLGEHDPHSQQPARPASSGQAGALSEVLPPRDYRTEEIHRRRGLSPSFRNPSRPEVLVNPFRTPFLNLSDYEELRRRRLGELDQQSQQPAHSPTSGQAGVLREALPARSDRIEEMHRRGLSRSFRSPSRSEVLKRSPSPGMSWSAYDSHLPLSVASAERSPAADFRQPASQRNVAGPFVGPSRPVQNFGQAAPSSPHATASVNFTRGIGIEHKGTGLRRRACTVAAIALATNNRFGTVRDLAVRIANFDGSSGVHFEDGKRILQELGVSASVHRQNDSWSQFPDRAIITVEGPRGPHAVYFRRKQDGSEVIYDMKKDGPVSPSGYRLCTGGYQYIALGER